MIYHVCCGALHNHRPYRPGLPRQKAIDELSRGLGVIYDSEVVEAINRVLHMDDMRVMVVDYDSGIVKGIEAELKLEGMEPSGYSDSAMALKDFTNKSFPLVVIELEMPGMDGIQLARKIKDLNSNTEVIIMAKHYTKEKMLRALRSGASDFIEKPIDLAIFRKSINRAAQIFAGKLPKH